MLRVVFSIGVVLLLAPPASASDLFVQGAAQGSVRPVGEGAYRLTLDPAGDVTTFSDRPQRTVFRQTTRSFVAAWRTLGFDRVPPNAALVIDGAPAGRDVLVFTLSAPRLSRRGGLSFRARPLPDAGGVLGRFAQRADRARAGSFGRASLFVDGAGTQLSLTPTGITAQGVGRIALRITLTGVTALSQPAPPPVPWWVTFFAGPPLGTRWQYTTTQVAPATLQIDITGFAQIARFLPSLTSTFAAVLAPQVTGTVTALPGNDTPLAGLGVALQSPALAKPLLVTASGTQSAG